jgi:hypothetical protein
VHFFIISPLSFRAENNPDQSTISTMVVHVGGSIARYLEFWGKGDEDIEKH